MKPNPHHNNMYLISDVNRLTYSECAKPHVGRKGRNALTQLNEHIEALRNNRITSQRTRQSNVMFTVTFQYASQDPPPSLLDSALLLLVHSAQAPYHHILASETVKVVIYNHIINTATTFCIN